MYAEETTKPIIEEEILQADPASPVQRGNTVTYNFKSSNSNDTITNVTADTNSLNNCYVISTASSNNIITVKVKITSNAEQGTYKLTVRGKIGNKSAYGETNIRVDGEYKKPQERPKEKIDEIDLISNSTSELKPGDDTSVIFEADRYFYGLSFYGIKATSEALATAIL